MVLTNLSNNIRQQIWKLHVARAACVAFTNLSKNICQYLSTNIKILCYAYCLRGINKFVKQYLSIFVNKYEEYRRLARHSLRAEANNAIACNGIGYHKKTPYETMQYNAIQCNTMQYHKVTKYIIWYNKMQWNTTILYDSIWYISDQKRALLAQKRAILGNRYQKITHRAAEWAPSGKPKVSIVTSGHGNVMIPLSRVHLRWNEGLFGRSVEVSEDAS